MLCRKELQNLVTQVLKRLELSDREAGRQAGLHHTTIGALRKGEVHSRETLAKFARAFNVPQKTIFEAAGMTSERITHRAIAKELKDISTRIERLASLVLEAE